jgi:hypothetical protein
MRKSKCLVSARNSRPYTTSSAGENSLGSAVPTKMVLEIGIEIVIVIEDLDPDFDPDFDFDRCGQQWLIYGPF